MVPFIFKDGTVIPADGYQGLNSGDCASKFPLIIGSTTYETKSFLFQDPAFESVLTGEPSAYLIEKYGDVTRKQTRQGFPRLRDYRLRTPFV